MNDDVSLNVKNVSFLGWKGVEISVSIESSAASFRLEVSDGDGTTSATLPIMEGDECAIKIGNDLVVTGYVDDIEPSFGANEHTITVAGRSKTADAIDCSVATSYEWNNKSFSAIAGALLKPYGISVKTDKNSGADTVISVCKIQPGETPFETLDRTARGIGILLTPDPSGALFLSKTGLERMKIALEEGVNIKTGSASFSSRDRFKTYTVLGQGEDVETFSLKGEAADKYIKRNRNMTIIAEENATQGYVTKRAKWESQVRAARGGTVHITVPGWRTTDGKLWWINRLVQVKSKTLRVDGELLIAEVVFRKDKDGTVTELTLRRKDAFATEPDVKSEPEKNPNDINSSAARIDQNQWTGAKK